jgi:hypothetical protein
MATLEIAPNGDSIIRVNDSELGTIVCALQEYRDNTTDKGNTEHIAVIELMTVIHMH